MTGTVEKTTIKLFTVAELDPVLTCECGQCFRWNADADGRYSGVASGRIARLWTEGEDVFIEADGDDLPFWRDYLDMETDYAAARRSLDGAGAYMRACAEHGAGIRILRQDKWETLCSFIISQCNNIPRIKGIVERLCAAFGAPIPGADGVYAFPAAERLAALGDGGLDFLRSGYRAGYILSAARAVASGKMDLEAAARLPGDGAWEALKALPGVGDKVANCVVLFGFHQMDAFPVDVWIRRVLREHFPPGFSPAQLGEYAGLAQQYMFYYARTEGRA